MVANLVSLLLDWPPYCLFVVDSALRLLLLSCVCTSWHKGVVSYLPAESLQVQSVIACV